jgi:hypothetical protein
MVLSIRQIPGQKRRKCVVIACNVDYAIMRIYRR